MNRITWEDQDHGHGKIGEIGFVTIGQTRIKIASINWSVKRNDPKPYVLRSEIPGWKNARHHETADAAKASMDRILRTFATAMLGEEPTVVVVDDPTTVRETRNAPNGVLIIPSEVAR